MSGSSAWRVVVSGPVVTSQSSNCAHSVLPAWPKMVISYVRDRTGITPPSWWLTLAASVPGGGVRVVTRFRVTPGFAELPGPLPALHRAFAGGQLTAAR